MSRILVLSISVLMLSSCSDPRPYFEDRSSRSRNSPLKDESGFANKDSGMIKITPLDEPTPFPSITPGITPGIKPATIGSTAFSGDIAGAGGKQRFYAFLQKNELKTIKLDLLLSDDQMQQINDVDRGKTWYFDLGFSDKDGFPTGGEMLIDVAKSKGDLKLNGNHLTGNIKLIDWSGPHQGLMSITAKPATSGAPVITIPEPFVASTPRPKATTRPRIVNKEIRDNNPPI